MSVADTSGLVEFASCKVNSKGEFDLTGVWQAGAIMDCVKKSSYFCCFVLPMIHGRKCGHLISVFEATVKK